MKLRIKEQRIIYSLINQPIPLSDSDQEALKFSRELLMLQWNVFTAKELIFKAIEKGILEFNQPPIKPNFKVQILDFEVLELLARGVNMKVDYLPSKQHEYREHYCVLKEKLNARNDEMIIVNALRFGLLTYKKGTYT